MSKSKKSYHNCNEKKQDTDERFDKVILLRRIVQKMKDSS